MTVAYFVMLSDRLGLRLFTFFVVSLMMTAAFSVVSLLLIPSVWAVAGLPQCVLYDIGSLIHLISGKRTVREVTE
jgi:hypothetical protein